MVRIADRETSEMHGNEDCLRDPDHLFATFLYLIFPTLSSSPYRSELLGRRINDSRYISVFLFGYILPISICCYTSLLNV